MTANSLVFDTSGGILSSPAAFQFLIFLSTKSSSSLRKRSQFDMQLLTYNARDRFMCNFQSVSE